MLESPAKDTTRYTADWYGEQSKGSLSSARRVVPLMMKHLGPNSVVDVGCGVGTWLRVFSELGVRTVLGLDGEYVDRSALQINQSSFVPTDLRSSFDAGQRFDLAVCLEVAEHLPPQNGAGLVEGLTKAAPNVLFSAAIPGQGGTDHINEQWQDHWRALFARAGYLPVDLVRPQVWGMPDVEPWYQQNAILYCSRNSLMAKVELKPVSDDVSLNLVHPIIYSRVRDEGLQYFSKTIRLLPGLFVSAVSKRLSRSS